MTHQDLNHFAHQMGTNTLLPDGMADIPQQTLDALVALVVLACAQTQWERSCQRHGYDKYQDGEAIAQRFGLTTLQ